MLALYRTADLEAGMLGEGSRRGTVYESRRSSVLVLAQRLGLVDTVGLRMIGDIDPEAAGLSCRVVAVVDTQLGPIVQAVACSEVEGVAVRQRCYSCTAVAEVRLRSGCWVASLSAARQERLMVCEHHSVFDPAGSEALEAQSHLKHRSWLPIFRTAAASPRLSSSGFGLRVELRQIC